MGAKIRLLFIFVFFVFANEMNVLKSEVIMSSTHSVRVDSVTNPAPSNSPRSAYSINSNQISSSQDDIVKKLMSKGCSQRYTLTCLKLDVVSFVDRLAEREEYQVFPGVTVVRENRTHDGDARKFSADLVASLAKDYPNDVDARVDAFLIRRVGQYLGSHVLNVKLMDEESFNSARKFGEETLAYYGLIGAQTGRKGGGGGGGKNKGMGMALMMGMMMMKGMMTAAGAAVAMGLAGKGAILGAIAAVLALVALLKGGDGGGKSVTYEVVSKPVYSHEHSHSHEVQHGHGGGYGHSSHGRSFETERTGDSDFSTSNAHSLAYYGHLPVTQPPS